MLDPKCHTFFLLYCKALEKMNCCFNRGMLQGLKVIKFVLLEHVLIYFPNNQPITYFINWKLLHSWLFHEISSRLASWGKVLEIRLGIQMQENHLSRFVFYVF